MLLNLMCHSIQWNDFVTTNGSISPQLFEVEISAGDPQSWVFPMTHYEFAY